MDVTYSVDDLVPMMYDESWSVVVLNFTGPPLPPLSGGGSHHSDGITQYILPTLALFIFTTIVIVGNSIVIMAVSTHSKLRRATTNKFIVSLAVADLMVGVFVLPFSSTNQVFRVKTCADVLNIK